MGEYKMSNTPRNYSKEFKEHAIKLIIEDGRKVSEVARELKISSSRLCIWKRKYLENNETAFPGEGNIVGDNARTTTLEKENKRLKEEVAILKKAAIFFATDT